MHSDITTNLKSLRLHGMAVAWEELIENGVTTRVDSSQWLLQHLLEAEDTNRAMRSISHQMKSARFPLHRDLAGFDSDHSQCRSGTVEPSSAWLICVFQSC